MIQTAPDKKQTKRNLERAVHKSNGLSAPGIWERLFTFAFRGLVYPQIWEDPRIDLEAMAVQPGQNIVAIASGGCNVLSYLTADPARITALDLNNAHIGLNRLKICAAQFMPDYESFRRFFADANSRQNVKAYESYLRLHLDAASRHYWDGRDWLGRRRISLFARNFYEHGLLGHFIGAVHFMSRLYGRDLGEMLHARDRQEQKLIYDRVVAPIFDERFVRWLVRQPASLIGLGIPPAQYYALAGSGPNGMHAVLRERVERLACGFDMSENYFARQAFGRGYGSQPNATLPPYLASANFDVVRARANRIDVKQQAFTAFLVSSADQSLDRYVLLDAQDWMNDEELTQLWREITRTARPGARVIFRTAAEPSLLPGRVPDAILDLWSYDEAACAEMTSRDRSAIYGGFHLYCLKEQA